MFNKLYEKIKNYIKENKIPIIIFALLYILFTYPLPYYVYTKGNTINISDKVIIAGEYKQKGSFSFSYVNELKGTVPVILLSYIIPNWELIKVEEKKATVTESIEDIDFRNRMFLIDSIQNATIVVYNKLGKKVNILDKNHYIVYIDKIANTDLEVKDEIVAVNDKTIESGEEYTNIVNSLNFNDTLEIKVIDSNNITKNKKIKILNYKGNKITGIYIISKLKYETDPNIKYNFSRQESGPSGGLMLALTIYNKLTEIDITKGKKIVGTGTIERNGNIGSVSGINHKLKGAVTNKADIFLVPNGDNYNEAIKLKDENNYNITIIGVSTFDDALNYLELMS
ncbi:MAG: hypothetical protein PHS45_03050 [Bacilli bacterium]|nr:hypothetical protein [Bacilli bacterium]